MIENKKYILVPNSHPWAILIADFFNDPSDYDEYLRVDPKIARRTGLKTTILRRGPNKLLIAKLDPVPAIKNEIHQLVWGNIPQIPMIMISRPTENEDVLSLMMKFLYPYDNISYPAQAAGILELLSSDTTLV